MMKEQKSALRGHGFPRLTRVRSSLLSFVRRKVCQSAAGGEQGAERKVQGNVGCCRLNLGNPRLARSQLGGELLLAQGALSPATAHGLADLQTKLNELALLVAQAQEILRVADAKPGGRQMIPCFLIHLAHSFWASFVRSGFIVPPQALAALGDDLWRGLLGSLGEDVGHKNGVCVRAVNDPPVMAAITDAKLMTAWPNTRHRAGMGQGQHFAFLQAPKQRPGFYSPLRGERRRLNLSVQQNQRLPFSAHGSIICRIRHTVKLRKEADGKRVWGVRT
jgi:hypothetical protein